MNKGDNGLTTDSNEITDKDTDRPMYIAFSKYNGSPSIRIPVEIVQQSRTIHCKALIDSGATGILMHHKFASQHQLATHDLARPIPVRKIDGINVFKMTLSMEIAQQNLRT